jgi:hypothetical protein
MITCHRIYLAARCLQRGYTLDEVRACIVSEGGDTITVDETHSSYPRALKPGSCKTGYLVSFSIAPTTCE